MCRRRTEAERNSLRLCRRRAEARHDCLDRTRYTSIRTGNTRACKPKHPRKRQGSCEITFKKAAEFLIVGLILTDKQVNTSMMSKWPFC